MTSVDYNYFQKIPKEDQLKTLIPMGTRPKLKRQSRTAFTVLFWTEDQAFLKKNQAAHTLPSTLDERFNGSETPANYYCSLF